VFINQISRVQNDIPISRISEKGHKKSRPEGGRPLEGRKKKKEEDELSFMFSL